MSRPGPYRGDDCSGVYCNAVTSGYATEHRENAWSKHVFVTTSITPSKTPFDLGIWTFERRCVIVSSSPQGTPRKRNPKARVRVTGSQHHISPGRRVSAGLGSGTRSGEPSKGPHMWDRRAGDMKRTVSRPNAHDLRMRGPVASVIRRSTEPPRRSG